MGERTVKLKRDIAVLILISFFSIALFNILAWFEQYVYRIFLPDFFLTWHIFLEVASIVMSFAIFANTFYTFEESSRLRSMVIACTFLAVSLLDLFHTFSYKGMPVFLTQSSAGKATAFWVVARLTMAFGLFGATLIPCERKTKGYQGVWVLFTIAYSIIILFLFHYHLGFFPPLFIEGQGLTPLKIYLEYLIIALQLVTAGLFFVFYIKGDCEEISHMLIVKALIFSIFSETAFTRYSNVYDTYNFLGHIYKIISYYLLFRALFVQNVQRPYQNLREAERKLSVYVDNLEQLVATRTAEITAANESLMNNLDYAKNILLALLPTDFPVIEGMEFSAKYMPCENVGGDFYNVFKLDDENIGVLIGDVAGHGVSAAMINVFINQNIHFKKEYDDGRQKIFTPRGVLMNCYHTYNQMPFPDEMYVVLFYGIYNTVSHELTYSSAGMNTRPLILEKGGRVKVLETDGFPICKFGSYFRPSYKSRSVKLTPGDALILHTDGLVEINRDRPDLFSQDQLVEFIKGLKGATAQQLCDDITDAYHTLLGDGKMLDDVTILVVKTY